MFRRAELGNSSKPGCSTATLHGRGTMAQIKQTFCSAGALPIGCSTRQVVLHAESKAPFILRAGLLNESGRESKCVQRLAIFPKNIERAARPHVIRIVLAPTLDGTCCLLNNRLVDGQIHGVVGIHVHLAHPRLCEITGIVGVRTSTSRIGAANIFE